jgi:hypothetical protein
MMDRKINKTHIGKLLDGRLLGRGDIEATHKTNMAMDLSFRAV